MTYVNVVSVETKPKFDPYRHSFNGVTSTIMRMNGDGAIIVCQQYASERPMQDEAEGRIITWEIPGHPLEECMRCWFEETIGLFQKVVDGHFLQWNTRAVIGELTEDALKNYECIVTSLNTYPFRFYDPILAGEWFRHTTDLPNPANRNECLEFAKDQIEEAKLGGLVLLGAMTYLRNRCAST